MTNQENFNQLYSLGKEAFDKGLYRQSLEYLTQAKTLIPEGTRQGGEVQIWLVTVYQALGQAEDAIALCQKLTTHPHHQLRKQAQDLLFILKAPRLERPQEWMTQIPDLSKVSDEDSKSPYLSITAKNHTGSKLNLENESNIDPQMITKDNNFLGFAFIILIIMILIFLGDSLF
jgi:tetratricopeptide (TPR) repeat protein